MEVKMGGFIVCEGNGKDDSDQRYFRPKVS